MDGRISEQFKSKVFVLSYSVLCSGRTCLDNLACGRRRSTVSVQRQDHLHVDVQRHQLVANQERNVCLQNAIRVASVAQDFEAGRWSFLGLETKKIVRKVDPKTTGEMEPHRGDYDARIR